MSCNYPRRYQPAPILIGIFDAPTLLALPGRLSRVGLMKLFRARIRRSLRVLRRFPTSKCDPVRCEFTPIEVHSVADAALVLVHSVRGVGVAGLVIFRAIRVRGYIPREWNFES